MRPLKIATLGAGGVVLALGAALLIWWTCIQTYHYTEVKPGVLYRDGFRSVRELTHAVKFGKVKTIVSLNDAREQEQDPFRDEQAFAESHGVKLVRIPIPLGGWPTDADVKQFLSVMSDANGQPVLVHCAQGVRRTGMMVAAYQRSLLGSDPAAVKAGILAWGHSERSISDVRKFVDIYDAQNRAVTETMSNSGNID